MQLNELEKTAGTVEEFDSHVSRFKFTDYDDGQKLPGTSVKYGHMHKYGHMLKKPENRENIEIQFEVFRQCCQEKEKCIRDTSGNTST